MVPLKTMYHAIALILNSTCSKFEIITLNGTRHQFFLVYLNKVSKHISQQSASHLILHNCLYSWLSVIIFTYFLSKHIRMQ